MERMENQEDSDNDLPLLPKSYEEFCEMFPSEEEEEEVELNIPLIHEELFEDNQYPLLDGGDFYIPEYDTEFFQLYPLDLIPFLPDEIFQELFSERIILLKVFGDNVTFGAVNDLSTNSDTPYDK
ncbi:hypothetical protein HN873_031104, partial [Arachis hypogaea]